VAIYRSSLGMSLLQPTESVMLKYYIFFHAIPMQVLLLCSFHIIKHLKLEEGQHLSPGVCLFPLSILTAVINGQNVTVLMLVAV